MATSTASATATTPLPTTAELRVYNTLTRSKEKLVPLVPGKVGIYLCGPTVYKPSHIGHMVGPVIFDAIKRYLVYNGYQVTLVVNVTDVDDKLINESRARGIDMPTLAKEMTDDYMRNLAAMGVDSIDHFPRATDNMDEIVRFTQDLIDKGFAYPADGDVYFDVGRDSDYGKLSGRSVESMQGEGGDMAARKRSPHDFALWKGAKAGEPAWPSPWGPGRPGWHIECSAMSRRLLGESFDIHGGGLDLVFPHHENEIAQSESCHGKPQAKYWMHNGLMQAAGEVGKVGGRNTRTDEAPPADQATQEAGKMGKSKGASAFRDLLAQFRAETIRYFLLKTQYRSPIYYSEEQIKSDDAALESFYRFFKRFQRATGQDYYALEAPARRDQGDKHLAGWSAQGDAETKLRAQASEARRRFLEAMDDDFNSGAAVGVLFDLVRTLNKFIDSEKLDTGNKPTESAVAALTRATAVFRELALTMGLFRTPSPPLAGSGDDSLVAPLVELLIRVRAEARKAKNFAMSDMIRDQLAALGIVIEDRPGGTEWSRNS
ncbi:MAG: cysteine--tRNA ligase [Pirellulales bacterium]|nr:cysteine--tRNA ligase [Pirellulales bacterium]